MKEFLAYSESVFRHYKNIWSIGGTVLSVVAFVLPSITTMRVDPSVGVLLIALSVYVASYRTYLEVKRGLPKEGELEVDIEREGFGADSWTAMPSHPLRFSVELSLRNTGEQDVRLQAIELQMAAWGSSPLVKREPPRLRVLRGNEAIGFPFTIGPTTWTDRLTVTVEVKKGYGDATDLAKRLSDFDVFSLEFELKYRLLDGSQRRKAFAVEGSFESFKAAVIEAWRRTNHPELIAIVEQGRSAS